jgi:hypothetical protein
MENSLKQYGIDLGLLFSGMMGSLILAKKQILHDSKTFLRIIGSSAAANYLTPFIAMILGVKNVQYFYCIAFIVGFFSLKMLSILGPIITDNIDCQEETFPEVSRTQEGRSRKRRTSRPTLSTKYSVCNRRVSRKKLEEA